MRRFVAKKTVLQNKIMQLERGEMKPKTVFTKSNLERQRRIYENAPVNDGWFGSGFKRMSKRCHTASTGCGWFANFGNNEQLAGGQNREFAGASVVWK